MRTRHTLAAIGLLIAVASCDSSSNVETVSGAPTRVDESSAVESSSTPSPAPSATTPETTTTPPPTTQPPEPVAIEATVTQISDEPRVGRLLVADTEPSLASGTAIPPLPGVPCGMTWDYVEPAWVEAMACEFDTEEAAEEYLTTWRTAIADPAPVWFGTAATTAPIADLPDWEGRLIAIPKRSETQLAEARGDLVRRFGTRVYVVTGSYWTEVPTDVVGPLIQMATAQQDFIDANNIIARPGMGRADEINRTSVRYLAPTWQELSSLAAQVNGTGAELYSGLSIDANNKVTERYSRSIEGFYSGENGYTQSIRAEIELYANVGQAQREIFGEVDRKCGPTVNPVPDSPNAFSCVDGDYWYFAFAQDGPLTLTLTLPSTIGADPAMVQQIMANWERRVEALGFPIGAGEVEPVTGQSRTDAPIPTDYFDSTLRDGLFTLTGASAVQRDGAYTSVRAEYASAPLANGVYDLRISVVPSVNDIIDKYGEAVAPDAFGVISPDAWAPYWNLSYDEGDFRDYDAMIARLLPSGAVLVFEARVFVVGDPQPTFDTPFVDPADVLVTSVWDRFQGFAFADFTPNETELEVRALAQSLTIIDDLYYASNEQLMPVVARAVPDSPPGTVAEWRKIWTPNGSPAVTQQVINFADPDVATAHVQQVVGGTPLTPFTDVDGIGGGYNVDAGLIVATHGKWVVIYTSPGRSNWTGLSSDDVLPTEVFAHTVARYFRMTGLE